MPIQNRNYDMDSDVSSDESYDSDQIDSDIEAELYSTLHHEVVSVEDKDNSDIQQNCSINIISVEDGTSEEKESLSPSDKLNMNRGFSFEKRKSNGKQIVENADVSLKRKSDLIANILDDIQVQTESPSKKQKTGNCLNMTRQPASSSGNVTIEISDSDSILSEPDESIFQKLETNIETFYIVSSDSDSSIISENSVDFDLNLSRNNNLNGNYKDVWKINDTDIYRTKRRSSGRYHENAVSNCTNCNKRGHVAKYCTEPKTMKCIFCGGMHFYLNCNRRVCLKCYRFGHESKRCRFPVDNILCSICNMRGHGEKCCPDLWRRYHLTTSQGRILKARLEYQSTPVYCCNCGREGHFGFQCDKGRMDRLSYPTLSSVISYEPPEEFVERFERNINAEGNIPEMHHPNSAPYQIAPRLNQVQKRFLRFQNNSHKKRRKQLDKLEKSKERNMSVKQKRRMNPSFISNCNFERGYMPIKQEVDFPRTPKVNQSPYVDEMPTTKITRKVRKKMNRKKRVMLQRKQMQAVQNHA